MRAEAFKVQTEHPGLEKKYLVINYWSLMDANWIWILRQK